MRPRLLDLFCGAGGAAMGYHRAGFDVIGVDLEPQPFYPFRFWQADVLALEGWVLQAFDAIHASPPCQAYSEGGRRWRVSHAKDQPMLIAPVRELLNESGRPYVIENVRGAASELRQPAWLWGWSVGLPELARPRLFETNWPLMVPPRVPKQAAMTIGVYGRAPDGRELNSRYPGKVRAARSLEEAQRVMEMDWADWQGTKEAIPPVYTELIGGQLLTWIRGE